MGDTAIAVHPKDNRFNHLIGKEVWRPYPKAKIKIIGDEYGPRIWYGLFKSYACS